MIKFFNKIRQRLLHEGKLRKYLIYAFGEILLVMVGILLALQVNNWNEESKEQEITTKYYTAFINDFERDKEQLSNLLDIRKRQSKSARFLLEMTESNVVDIDLFYNNYYFIFPFHRFVPNSNTLEEVLNSSHLRFITDETIKNRLLDLRNSYENIRLAEEHVYEDRVAYLYNEKTLNNIEFNGLFIAGTSLEELKKEAVFSKSKDADVFRSDADYFIRDRHFKSFLNLLDYNLVFIIPQIEAALNDCNTLIELLKAKRFND